MYHVNTTHLFRGEKMKKIIGTILLTLMITATILPVAEALTRIESNNPPSEPTCGFSTVAWWKFDEGNGSIAHDSSGNNLTGDIVNGLWKNGSAMNDTALSFDKTQNRFVIVEDNSLFDIKTLEISADFKPASDIRAWPRGYHTLVSKEFQYILRFANNYTDGKAALSAIVFFDRSFFTHKAVTVFFDDLNSSLWPVIGEWNTVKMTFDGDALKLFLNENLLGTTWINTTINPLHFSDADLIIGSHQMGASLPPQSSADEFIGVIDNVKIIGEPGGLSSENNDNTKTLICGLIREDPTTGTRNGILRFRATGLANKGWISLKDFPFPFELERFGTVSDLGNIKIILAVFEGKP